MEGNRIGMRYDVQITVDKVAAKKARQKHRRYQGLKDRNKSLTRENLELRAELAIVKHMAIYAIALRQQTEGSYDKSNSKEPCGR
jgi:hypothetical protein